MGDLYFLCIRLPVKGIIYPHVSNKVFKLYMCNSYHLFFDLGKTAQ